MPPLFAMRPARDAGGGVMTVGTKKVASPFPHVFVEKVEIFEE